ncbi:MAG: hypothetical protein ACRC1K_13390 [Planctomycetia bacterium]
MSLSQRRIVRAAFLIQLVVGVLMLLAGLAAPLRPYFQLDVVLTPEQLADEGTRNTTQALLLKASGNEWLFWIGGGSIVVGASLVGLTTTRVANSSAPCVNEGVVPPPLP